MECYTLCNSQKLVFLRVLKVLARKLNRVLTSPVWYVKITEVYYVVNNKKKRRKKKKKYLSAFRVLLDISDIYNMLKNIITSKIWL